MKYYLIAGESSGDLHGSNLIKSLKKKDIKSNFRCWGGDLMKFAGGDLIRHYKKLNFMGFLDIIKNFYIILKNLSFCKKDILLYKPDVLILIDYPSFNLRIASFAKSHGIKVVYYISPKIWAWNSFRIYNIKKSIDKMIVILPFEKKFYKHYNMKVDFVGHPILDAIIQKKILKKKFLKIHKLDNRPIIALLPGSRKQEIKLILPIMWSIRTLFPSYQFVISIAPSQEKKYYKSILKEDFLYVKNDTYSLLNLSQAALVTSGTATLEAALLNVPQIVCYKTNYLSYEIGRRLIRNIKFISLVNLIMDKEVVKELIQKNLNLKNLEKELKIILNLYYRKKIIFYYNKLKKKLGKVGASKRAAKKIITFLN